MPNLKLERDIKGNDFGVGTIERGLESIINLLLQGTDHTGKRGVNSDLNLVDQLVSYLLEVSNMALDDARGGEEIKNGLVKLRLRVVNIGEDLLQRGDNISERSGNCEGVLGVQLSSIVEVVGDRLDLAAQIDGSVLELDQRNNVVEEAMLEVNNEAVQCVDISSQVADIIHQSIDISSKDGGESSEERKKPQHFTGGVGSEMSDSRK